MFIKHWTSKGLITLFVSMDDIIMIGNDPREREALRQYLTREFEIKELVRLKYFLGINVVHSKKGIFVS